MTGRRPLHVALVTDWFHPRVGGIEVHLEALARRLRERGVVVTVVTAWPGPDQVEGIPVVRLPLRLVPGLGVSLSPLALTRALLGALREYGPFDLVHSHLSFGSTLGMAAGFVAPREGLPTLGTFHSVYGALGWYYRAARPILRWHRWPFRATAVSDAVARDLGWMMPERAVTLLPCAIDPAEWPPIRPAPREGELRLVTTARLQRRKRVDALLRTLAAVRREVGDRVTVTLEVLGDGPDRGKLESLARSLGVASAVRFLGPGTASDVRALLGRGDVFVNAAHLESFGIAGLEALSSGIPVVARKEGGMGTFVQDGVNGRLVGSDEEMVRVLARLALDPAGVRALASGAAAGVPRDFTWEAVLDQHVGLYHALVQGAGDAGQSLPASVPT